MGKRCIRTWGRLLAVAVILTTVTAASAVAATSTTPAAAPAPLASNALFTNNLGQGMSGPDVLALQQRLAVLGFDPGPVNGFFGVPTVQSVWAFQHLIGVTATGVVSPALWLQMLQPFTVIPRGAGTTHFEIYLQQQVGVLFVGGQVRLITHVSTGSGQPFGCNPTCSIAVTPPGSFRFGGRFTGWQNGTLGMLYNPVYFNGGIAVHGALSVPNYPASHGCTRIPMHIAEYFPSLVHTGDSVYVFAPTVAPVVSTQPVTPTRLVNGSFEHSTSGWMAAGTTNLAGYTDATVAHDGTSYAATNAWAPGGGTFQDVATTVNAGDGFAGTLWLRAQDVPTSGLVCLWALGGGAAENNCEPYAVDASAWQQFAIVLNPAASHTTLRLQLYANVGGTTLLDTASMGRQWLLRSGSFERSSAGWSVGGGTNFAAYNDPSVAHDGSWYVATNTSSPGGGIFQDVGTAVGSGDSVVATVWLRAQDVPASGLLCLWALGVSAAENNCQGYSVDSSAWQPFQVVLNPVSGHTLLRLQLYVNPGGTTRVDTATLDKALPVRNGSFETSSASWLGAPSSNVARYNDATVAHDGVWYEATNTTAAGGGVFQDLTWPITAGSTFQATAWLSAQDVPASGSLCLWALGGTNEWVCQRYSAVAGTWQQVQVVLDATSQHSTLRLQIYADPGGTTRLDTVSVR